MRYDNNLGSRQHVRKFRIYKISRKKQAKLAEPCKLLTWRVAYGNFVLFKCMSFQFAVGILDYYRNKNSIGIGYSYRRFLESRTKRDPWGRSLPYSITFGAPKPVDWDDYTWLTER